MLTRLRLAASKVTKRMWFPSTLYGALGIITALAGAFLKFLIPSGLAARIGADSVGNILGILAASMLTVTTFSLSTMVSAYGSASSSATPRAARLLIEDTRAQGALATFIGAFLFSIVGLIALSTGMYGDSGRLWAGLAVARQSAEHRSAFVQLHFPSERGGNHFPRLDALVGSAQGQCRGGSAPAVAHFLLPAF